MKIMTNISTMFSFCCSLFAIVGMMDIQSWYSMNARLSARWGRSADWCWSCQNAIWFWSAARLLNGLLQSEFAELLEVFRAQHLGHQQKEHKVRRENQLENSWGSARSPKCGMKDLHPKCVRNTRRRKMKWAGKPHNSWNRCKRQGQTCAFKKKKDHPHPSTCTAAMYCSICIKGQFLLTVSNVLSQNWPGSPKIPHTDHQWNQSSSQWH